MTHIVLYTTKGVDISKLEKFSDPKFLPIAVGRAPDSSFVYGIHGLDPETVKNTKKTGILKNTEALNYLASKMTVSVELLYLVTKFEKFTGDRNSDLQVEGIGTGKYISAVKQWVKYIKDRNGIIGYFDYDAVYVKVIK